MHVKAVGWRYAPRLDPSKKRALSSHLFSFKTRAMRSNPMSECKIWESSINGKSPNFAEQALP